MRVQHQNKVTAIAHEGVQYEADFDGAISVPDHVGAQLLRFEGWSQAGDLPGVLANVEYEPVPDVDAEDPRDAEIAFLRQQLAHAESLVVAQSKPNIIIDGEAGGVPVPASDEEFAEHLAKTPHTTAKPRAPRAKKAAEPVVEAADAE